MNCIEQAQDLGAEIYKTLRGIQDDFGVDLDTLEEILKDTLLHMRVDDIEEQQKA